MRRQLLGFTLIVVLAALPLLPTLTGFYPMTPAVVTAAPPLPGPNDLNATKPWLIYEEYTPANPAGNSSLISIVVDLVNASDIGECRAGDLITHKFRLYNSTHTDVLLEDDLEYVSGYGWAVLNYSLLPTLFHHDNYTSYRINCFFERDTGVEIWNATSAYSNSFNYLHRLTVGRPDFKYIGDTSDFIDITVEHITSTVWGSLTQANSTIVITQKSNTSNTLIFHNELIYNISSTHWEVFDLNISSLVQDEIYTIRVFANYTLTIPHQTGSSSISDEFVFRGPFLRIANPIVIYVGRDVQFLNITVATVWHSLFGYLNDTGIGIANFSIYLSTGGAALITDVLSFNSSGGNWYLANYNLTDYIELGIIQIGEYYNVSTFFHALGQKGREAVNATSSFSKPFILDRDPPNVDAAYTTPISPTDEDFVIITGEVSDDALVHTVICRYYNGTDWVNVTMRGTRGKQANYTTTIPAFPERAIIQYQIFVNDTQGAWANSSIYSFTVADTPPVIAYVSFLPHTPKDIDQVIVNATITDGTGVQQVFLSYSFDGIIWVTIEMQSIGNSIYQATIPAHGPLPNYQFESVLFRIEAFDVYDNLRQSADYAYTIQGTIPAIDPLLGLLILSSIAIAVVAIIILFKVYEQF